MRVRVMVFAALLAAAATAGGCGGGDDDTAAPAEPTPASEVPSTGVPAATPVDAAVCLEAAGLTVTAATAGESGAVDRLLAEGDPGTATITWYADEGLAFDAHRALLDAQEPDSTVGRTSEAVYVAAGPDFSALGRTVTACL